MSSMHRDDSGWIVAAFVLADRDGGCGAVRVVTAAENWRAAARKLRELGYKKVDSRPGEVALQDEESQLALRTPGAVYERPWSAPGQWVRIDAG